MKFSDVYPVRCQWPARLMAADGKKWCSVPIVSPNALCHEELSLYGSVALDSRIVEISWKSLPEHRAGCKTVVHCTNNGR